MFAAGQIRQHEMHSAAVRSGGYVRPRDREIISQEAAVAPILSDCGCVLLAALEPSAGGMVVNKKPANTHRLG